MLTMKDLIQALPLKKIHITDASALIATLAVGAPSLFDYFNNAHEYRWVALGLYFSIFFLLALREEILNKSHLPIDFYLTIQTILVISLLTLPPHHEFIVILFFVLSAISTTLLPGKKGYLWITVFTLITIIFFF